MSEGINKYIFFINFGILFGTSQSYTSNYLTSEYGWNKSYDNDGFGGYLSGGYQFSKNFELKATMILDVFNDTAPPDSLFGSSLTSTTIQFLYKYHFNFHKDLYDGVQ